MKQLSLSRLLFSLKKEKISPVSVLKKSSTTDDIVYITEHIYITLNKDAVFIVNDKPNKFSLYETSGSMTDIMLKLQKAIHE